MASVAPGDRVLVGRLRASRPYGPPRAYGQSTGFIGPVDAALSPDGRTLAVTSGVGVDIVDVATMHKRAAHADAATAQGFVRFTPDRRFLVAGSTEGWARLWSTALGSRSRRVSAGAPARCCGH